MKKLILFSLIILGYAHVQAQSTAIDKYFDDYRDQDSFTKIEMSAKAFELMAKIDCDDDELNDIKEMASQINKLHVLVDSERLTAMSDYKKGLQYLEDDYEELMSFSDKQGAFKFFIDESAGVVKELVIFGANDSTLAIVSLTGAMDLKKIGQFSSQISRQTMNTMKKSHQVDKMVIYPNPVQQGRNITLDTPSEMRNVNIEIYSSGGKKVESLFDFNSGDKINTASLSPDQYIVHVISDGITITKKFIVE